MCSDPVIKHRSKTSVTSFVIFPDMHFNFVIVTLDFLCVITFWEDIVY